MKLKVFIKKVTNTVSSIALMLMMCFSFSTYAQGLMETEYFWGTDPGQGNGTAVNAVDGAFDETVEALISSGVSLPGSQGVHRFSIRIRDDNNNWGPVFSVNVQVEPSSVNSRDIEVTQAEYFFNNDPGEGNANPMVAFDGAFDEAVEAIMQTNIGLPGSGVGAHKFSVRIKDVNNVWSPVFSTIIRVEPSSVSSRDIKITAAECFFNTDPGEGNGMPLLAFDGNFNSAFEIVKGGNITAPVDSGWNTLYVRVRDAESFWGPEFGVVVFMDTTIGSFVASISGNQSACDDDNLSGYTYGTSSTVGHTYDWAITGGTINSGNGTNIVDVTWTTAPHSLQLIECDGGLYCDTALLDFTVYPNYVFNVYSAICEGDSVVLGGGWQSAPGIFMDTFQTVNGCDSVRVTDLNVWPSDSLGFNVQICSGQSYFAGGANQTTSGTYTDYFQSAKGCDSTVTTVLEVLSVITFQNNVSICDGESYLAGGAQQTTAGTYYDTLQATAGCDSIVETNLSVLSTSIDIYAYTICEGDSINVTGNWVFGAGTHYDTLTNAAGCDSIIAVDLTLWDAQEDTVAIDICDGETYFAEGADQSTSGVYIDTFVNMDGCDSVIITKLSVKDNPPTPLITQNGNVLSTDTGYAAYEWFLGGIFINNTNSSSYTALVDGSYSVEVTDAFGCTTMSGIQIVTNVGIETISSDHVAIFPNPTTGLVNVRLSGVPLNDVRLYDMAGKQLLDDSHLSGYDHTLDLSSYQQGIYFVQLQSAGKVYRERLVLVR